MGENDISINKHLYFDTENGLFRATTEASQIIYREKNLICSYSGINEWINHFVCEMIDFCSGASVYNYALGTRRHEKELAELWKEDKEHVIKFINYTLEDDWSKKMYELIERIIDESKAI